MTRSTTCIGLLFLALGVLTSAASGSFDDPNKDPINLEKSANLFNGDDLKGWKAHGDKNNWVVGRVSLDEKDSSKFAVSELKPGMLGGPGAWLLVNKEVGSNLYTEQKFGDGTIELEFLLSKGSTSSLFLLGEYEIKLADSHGKDKLGADDMGVIHGKAAKVNACDKPGEWQKLAVELKGERAGVRFTKVTLNGKVIHEDLEVKEPAKKGLTGKNVKEGPLMIGGTGPIAVRSIHVTNAAKK